MSNFYSAGDWLSTGHSTTDPIPEITPEMRARWERIQKIAEAHNFALTGEEISAILAKEDKS